MLRSRGSPTALETAGAPSKYLRMPPSIPPRTAAADQALPVNVPASVRPPLAPLIDVKPTGGVRSGSWAAGRRDRETHERECADHDVERGGEHGCAY